MSCLPILSICIPTFNRANYLQDTLESIVCQKRFLETGDVEIVVSDNCSDDNTYDVVSSYRNLHKDKISYFRNEQNVKDLNFEMALSRGKGNFLKLNNDTLVHLDGSLDKMLRIIENSPKANIIFFSNRTLKLKEVKPFYTLDEFIGTASYISTWIGGFGMWKNDFENFENFSEKVDLQLVQTDVLCRVIADKSFNEGVIYDEKLCNSVTPSQKGGYNLVKVFVDSYFTILGKYLEEGRLSDRTFRKEKIRILRFYILPKLRKMVTRGKKLNFDTEGLSKYMDKHYSKELYYPLVVFIIAFYKIAFRLKKKAV